MSNLHRLFDSDRKPAFWVWLLLAGLTACFMVIAILSQDSYGGADDLHHYRIARYAFQYPHYFLDHWGKPVFTALSAPFAQFGYNGIKIYNVIAAVLTTMFTFLVSRRMNVSYAWIVMPFVLFTPVFTSLIPSAMTEITGALVFILSVYLYLRGNYSVAAIVISFIPYARTEAVLILMSFGLMYMIRRQWKYIPLLLTGTLFYSFVGGFYFKDFLWIINQMPYSTQSAGIYGKGSFWFYIENTKFIWGFPLAVLFSVGTLVTIYQFVRSGLSFREQTGAELLLLLLPLVLVFLFHSLAWYLGTGALALYRFLALVVPSFAFFSLKGLAFLIRIPEKFISGRISSWIGAMVALLFVVHAPFRAYRFPVPISPSRAVIAQACNFLHAERLDTNMIYYYDPNVFVLLGIDPHDRSKINERIPTATEPGKDIPAGSIVIWDAHFGPNEGGLPKERLLAHPCFDSLAVFRPAHPFKVLGNYDYEVYVFRYTGCTDEGSE